MLLKKSRSRTTRSEDSPELRPMFRDPRNFGLVVKTYQNLLFGYVFNMVHDYHLAEDLSQETFTKAYKALGSYNPKHPFSAWLLRIAHNHGIDYLRHRKLQTVSYDSVVQGDPAHEASLAGPESVSAGAEATQQRNAIQKAIYALPVDYRSVIVLRYLNGTKLEEISYILNIPVGTVKSRINRARQILQQQLDAPDIRPSSRRRDEGR